MNEPLDRIDFEIIRALQNNARLSNKELAAKAQLAPSTCLERVRRLQRLKVLGESHTEVDPQALGIGLQALIFVRLGRHSRTHVAAFRKHCLALVETVAIYHVAGQQDFIVHVAVPDAARLRDLALDAFTTRPEVAQIETHLIFEHARKSTLPIFVTPSAPR